jgi:glucose/arabinose dehydrogenase
MTRYLFPVLGLVAALPLSSGAEEKPIEKSVKGNIFRPAKLEPTDEYIAKLKLPEGFKITKVAEKLEAPRMMALAPNGDLYVTRRGPIGDVLLLKGAGTAEKAGPPETVAKLEDVHGIAIRDGKMYLAAVRKLYVADILPDGKLSEPKVIYDDFPDAGQHPNRTMTFSPTGELFYSAGSATNSAAEPNKESATMLVVKPDGSGREIFAEGLRNTIGFDWHPVTGEMWGMDHGIDWMGDEEQKEELNLLQKGGNYGWPFVYEDGKANLEDDPKESKKMTWEEYAKVCENFVLGAEAHSAPMALTFYRGGQFPKEYENDAFVTFHGSWNRAEPEGYSVMRLKFKDGKPVEFEDFLTGFLVKDKRAQFGRPCGLIQAPDGSLLLSDDSGGVIYRISYAGK